MTAIKCHLPQSYLARHGETAWSRLGRHTGLSDVPLTGNGENSARLLGQRLNGSSFSEVLFSPLQRAARTCALAGFAGDAKIDYDLVEWDYGDYEGKTTEEIRQAWPGWNIFRDGCPGGESLGQVAARADRVIARLRGLHEDALLFSHGHFLRVLAARWLDLDPRAGRGLLLSTAALCAIGYEHDRDDPVIRLWNDDIYLHR